MTSNLKDYDFLLPDELIAQKPSRLRDHSKLMVLDRQKGQISHSFFYHLPDFLKKQDLIVANDTRVIPARIFGRKKTGGWVELFLVNFIENTGPDSQTWECLIKNPGKVDENPVIYFSPDLTAKILQHSDNGLFTVQLNYRGDFGEIIKKIGKTPLPPYIKRQRQESDNLLDRSRYQTIYAKKEGAVAAPTAGFHFTPSVMGDIKKIGADFAFVTLHVSYGTFQPIREETYTEHNMHREFYSVSNAAAEKINKVRKEKGRIVSVGTTTTRVLETKATKNGLIDKGDGYTDLFIFPGYGFKIADAIITNFHLPKSSLLLLVSAFAGKELIMEAYRQAVEKKYRFFSYGDAMLIV